MRSRVFRAALALVLVALTAVSALAATCGSCGHDNAEGMKFCGNCGEKLPAPHDINMPGQLTRSGDIARKVDQAVVGIFNAENGETVELGSGFLVSPDGHVLTNAHTIAGILPRGLGIKLPNGEVYDKVSVFGVDNGRDIALLKVRGFALASVKLGDSDIVQEGEWVVSVGNPSGSERVVAEGIILGTHKLEDDFTLHEISAVLSPGATGGPVLNGKGQIIGIATQRTIEGEPLSFSIPIDYGKAVIENPADFERMAVKTVVRGTVEVISLGNCLFCYDGTCPVCGGDGKYDQACLFCNGTGKCIACGGKGSVKCVYCRGSGEVRGKMVRCARCKGKGRNPITYMPCAACNEKGFVFKKGKARCPTCAGTGRTRCTRCKTSGKCMVCKGVGHDVVQCSSCSGAGTCARCGGKRFLSASETKERDEVAGPVDILQVLSPGPGIWMVYVDNKPKGKAPVRIEEVKPGIHKVRVVGAGKDNEGMVFSYTVDFARGMCAIIVTDLGTESARAEEAKALKSVWEEWRKGQEASRAGNWARARQHYQAALSWRSKAGYDDWDEQACRLRAAIAWCWIQDGQFREALRIIQEVSEQNRAFEEEILDELIELLKSAQKKAP